VIAAGPGSGGVDDAREDCDVCGAGTLARCRYCRRPVCSDHRRLAAHSCTGPQVGYAVDAPGRSRPDAPGTEARSAGPTMGIGAVAVAAVVLLGVAALVVAALPPGTLGGLGGSVAGPDGGSGTLDVERTERLVHDRVVAERRERGLKAVERDEALAAFAAGHSADMAEHGYVGHEAPDGTPLRKRYERAGFDCLGGEVAYALSSVGGGYDARDVAELTTRAWLRSDGHRETLLRERFSKGGVGIAVENESGRERVYVTMNFC